MILVGQNYWPNWGHYRWPLTADKSKPMSIGSAQKIYYQAKERAGITRGRGIQIDRAISFEELQMNLADIGCIHPQKKSSLIGEGIEILSVF